MKHISIKEEVKIPGSNIILEAGDRLYFSFKKSQYREDYMTPIEFFVNKLTNSLGFKLTDDNEEFVTFSRDDISVIFDREGDFYQISLGKKIFTFKGIVNKNFFGQLLEFIVSYIKVSRYLKK